MVHNDKTLEYFDLITYYMTSYIINFSLQTIQLPYNKDFLRLIRENSSCYMKRRKPTFSGSNRYVRETC